MTYGSFARRGGGGRVTNPFARPNFEFVYEDVGIYETAGVFDGAWDDTVNGIPCSSGGGSPVTVWRNGKRAVTFGATCGNLFDLATTATELTWFFALKIPLVGGFGSGAGPSSTATELLKNFPLYFKSTNVIGSQPGTGGNSDSALDMSPYYGLDAIISVRQAAAGIRYVMRIDGVSGRVITTSAGQACGTTQGLSLGGWFGGLGFEGLLGTPLALDGRVQGAVSDADQEEGVDYCAWEYALITP